MWGIPQQLLMNTFLSRITPTRVGNTGQDADDQHTDQDHPHPCGEYHNLEISKFAPKGSPPPVWGIPLNKRVNQLPRGITPTRVGNTFNAGTKTCLAQDHPHPCGEYLKDKKSISYKEGSPPPVWGIRNGR